MADGRRALITGITGFTGRYVAEELTLAGYEVYGLGSHEVDLPRYARVDLMDRKAVRDLVARVRPNVVLHLAGLTFIALDNAEAFYRINIIGTRNLIEAVAVKADEINCLLLASSANVYGNSTEGVLTESVSPMPANDYAVSKLAMEYMASLWFARLPIVIARPFNYTGVGQAETFLIPKIVSYFRRQAQEIELGNLDVSRDFSDVRAVANAYCRLVQACPAGRIINICSERCHSLREVLDMVASIAGRKITVQVNPALVRANEVRSLMGSASLLRQIIGEWNPPPLEETLAWMFNNNIEPGAQY